MHFSFWIPSDKYLSIHIKAALTKFSNAIYRFDTANYINSDYFLVFFLLLLSLFFLTWDRIDNEKTFRTDSIYVTYEGFRSMYTNNSKYEILSRICIRLTSWMQTNLFFSVSNEDQKKKTNLNMQFFRE